MSRLKVRTEVVTPAKAKQWLKTNRHNRPLSRGYLRSLVNAIRAGEWEDNGETIKFNGAGRLVDGQHRLTAVVQTNRPLPMTVVEGLNETAFDTIDQGKRRQVADALARDGVPYYITVAGALRYYRAVLTGVGSLTTRMTIVDAVDLFEANRKIVDAATYVCARAQQRVMPATIAAGLLWTFGKKNRVAAHKFFDSLLTGAGITSKVSPVYRLRGYLVANRATTIERRDIFLLTIKAWNFSRRRSRSYTNKITADDEAFAIHK